MATLTGQELVKLALARLANGSAADLVRELRLGEVMRSVDPAAQVRRWRDGKHAPSYAVTMRLLEGLGAIRSDVLVADRQEAAAAMQAEVVSLGRLLDRLAAGDDQPLQEEPPQSRPGAD